MENYNASKTIKKYKITLISSLLILGIAVVAFSLLFQDKFIFLIFLYFLIGSLIKRFLFGKFINSALTVELDPKKYNELITTAKMHSKHYLHYIISLTFLGDYQTTLNLCTKLLNDTKLRKYRYIYLTYIARCYFYSNDLENLTATCKLFNSFLEEEQNDEKIKNTYPVFEFFNSYIKEDYINCFEYLYKQKNNPKFAKSKLDQISFDYSLAVIFYKSGDLKTANEKFKNIIDTAPLLNFATLSQKYINAIENNEDNLIEEKLFVDEDFTFPDDNGAFKKIKIFRIFLYTTLTIFALIYIISLVIPEQIIHFKGLDYYSTRNDIVALYGEPDEIREFIYPKGKYYDYYYEKTFLGIKGSLVVEYLNDNDSVFLVQFFIASKDYKNEAEYKAAVNKTYKYFSKNISKIYKYDESTEDEIKVTWSIPKYGFSYMIYETQIILDENSISGETTSDSTVFQFNTHKLNK